MSRAGGNLVGGGGPAGDPGGSPWSVLETVPELFLETPMHLTFIFCEAPTKTTPPPTRAFISPAGARSPGPPDPGLGPGRPRPVRVWAGPRRSGNLKMYHAYQIKPIIILKMYHTNPRA